MVAAVLVERVDQATQIGLQRVEPIGHVFGNIVPLHYFGRVVRAPATVSAPTEPVERIVARPVPADSFPMTTSVVTAAITTIGMTACTARIMT